MLQAPVQVLAFDVFGTVVDWHGSITREVTQRYPHVDADAFARAWRSGYKPAMAKVAGAELGWTRIDDLHRMILEDLLPHFGLSHLGEASRRELNQAWHRLDPWADVVTGLKRLKSKYILCTLSNGNMSLLTHLSKHGGLPWDCIFSAETFRAYKPDPRTYLGVAEWLDVAPQEVMLVATHQDDLDAARSCGLQTAYIDRPTEWGDPAHKTEPVGSNNTLRAANFLDLADLLGV